MDAQLRLMPRPEPTGPQPEATADDRSVEAPVRWRIDDTAKAVGREGITRAREALRQARRPHDHDGHTTAA